MANDRKNKKQSSTNSSKLQDKTNITNEELLESILNKKKAKKIKSTSKVEKEKIEKVINEEIENKEKQPLNTKETKPIKESSKSTKKSTTISKDSKKTTKTTRKTKQTKSSEINADDLLTSIVAKKKVRALKKSSTKEEKQNDQQTVQNAITNDKTSETIQSEKEGKTNNSEKQDVDKKRVINSQNTEIKTEDKEKQLDNQEGKNDSASTSKLDDLIITRKITFDDEKINLKSKKTLTELRKAIEEFDRLETLSEIASSLDKINDLNEEPIKSIEAAERKKEKRELFKTSMLVWGKRSDRYADEQEKNKNREKTEKNLSNDIDKSKEIQEETDEFDYLRSLGDFAVEEVRPQNLKKRVYVDKREKNACILLITCLLLLAVLLLLLFVYLSSSKKLSFSAQIEPKVIDVMASNQIIEEKVKDYTECLSAPFNNEDNTIDFTEKVIELGNYLDENYNASVAFENLQTGYVYSYLPDTIFYAASTIKALDALYIYTAAAKGQIDLEEKLVYDSSHQYVSSKGLEQYQFGDEISIRNLVKYAVVYSDNSAHQMLIEYIGKSVLREFGQSLGASITLTSSDDFGNINVTDALIYMKAIHDFINKNAILGAELKELFVTAEQNDIALPELGIEAAHKYGSYDYYYHDYGIVYANSPYVVAILTTEGKDNYEEKVKDINHHIYELNQLLTTNRENRCQIKVYGK